MAPNPPPDRWTAREDKILSGFRHPMEIQAFLDTLGYDPEPGARSPRVVLRTRRAHCFGGSLFAAAALRRLGHPPLLVDLVAVNDDDHLLAPFREGRHWGAVAKSNFTTLRYREPVYASLRELVMSYFDLYFNSKGEKTLRSYSRPLDLRAFDAAGWMWDEQPLDAVEERIERSRHYRLLTAAMERRLVPVSPTLLEAGLLGCNPDGLYEPS